MNELLTKYRKVFSGCEFSATRHKSIRLKDSLLELATAISPNEQSDVYGTGALIEDFETEVAQLLGKEAALFMPSGTMAQPIALRVWSDLAGTEFVGLHGTSHLALHEQNSYQILHRLKGVILGNIQNVPKLDDLKAAATSPLSAILLELPMREIGGQLPQWNELVEQSTWARQNNIKLHMDGARLWQCPAAYDKSLAEISDLFDSVYVSFYKDLGGISGAILAGDKRFIESAKIWQRRMGGNLHALYPFIVSAREGLKKHLPKLPDKLIQAKWLAKQLNKYPEFQTWPLVPHTNMFRLRVNCNPDNYFKNAAKWMSESNTALITPPYQISEDYIMCELSFGDAFEQKTDQEWSDILADFVAKVFSTPTAKIDVDGEV